MAGIDHLKAQKTWSDSNYDHFSKVKNRDKDAYRRFKGPCFFQREGYLSGMDGARSEMVKK